MPPRAEAVPPALPRVISSGVSGGSRRSLVVALLVLLTLGGYVAYDIWRSRMIALEAGTSHVTALNGALGRQAELSVRSIDLIVRSSAGAVAADEPGRPGFEGRIRAHFRYLTDATPFVATLLYADADGKVRVHSREEDVGGVSIADRPHFLVHRDHATAGLYVSRPFEPRLGERGLRVAFTRRVHGPGGRFAGVVAATMFVEELTRHYAEVLDFAGAATTLLRTDGALIGRHPPVAGMYGRDYRDLQSLRGYHDGNLRGTIRVKSFESPFDSRPRVLSYTAVDGSPLVLATSIAEEDLLGTWRGEARRSLLLGLAGLALLGILFAMSIRYQRASERQAAALALGEERLRLALEASNQGLYDIDYVTGAMEVSPEYARLLGFDPATFRESCIAHIDRIHPEDMPRYEHLFEAHSLDRSKDFRVEYRQRARSGEWKWTLSTGEIVSRDATGRPTRMVGTLLDITEIKSAENALKELNATLERRVEERTAQLQRSNTDLAAALEGLESFAYSVSHDLRGPLRGIDGYAKLALDRLSELPDESEPREHLDKVRAAVARMSEVISDLLTLSRIMREPLRAREVDLSTLAREIAAELDRKDPGRKIEWRIAGGLAARGDPGMLRILLENLLENAWKYTARRDGAVIDFGAEAAEDGSPVFFVRDNGAGFDMAYSAMLFEPFRRLHGPHEFEGTGIGLATVMRVIKRHGGAVRGEGEVGRGAVFRFTLGRT